MLNLNGANKKIDGIDEADRDQDAEDAALQTWAKLAEWFFWVKGQGDDWQSAFKDLPPDDPIKTLQRDLLWCFRFFAGYFPDRVKKGDWVSRSKTCLEYYQTCALDELTPDELAQKEYFYNAIEWATEMIQQEEIWSQQE